MGSPGEMTYTATLKLPKGMIVELPKNVKVEEDFASYTATYSFKGGVVSGIRKLKIIANEIPGSKRGAYSKFVESMIEDQGHYMAVTGAGDIEAGEMPQAPGHSENADAQKLYQKGYESIQLGAPQAATTALEQALRLDPKWVDCWVLLGNVHMIAYQFEQGTQAYQKAVALEPTNVNNRKLLAMALTVSHHDVAAIEAWQEVLKLNPDDTLSGEKLLGLLLETGKSKEALAYLLKAEEDHGEVPETQRQLSRAYLEMREDEKAMEHFHKALELDSSPAMLNAVAYSMAEAQRVLNDALKYAEEAVKETEEQSAKADGLDSSNFGITASLAAEWDTLGWVKFRLGDYETATKYLESAWSVMQAPAIGDHLGQVYEKTGKKRQAAQTYAMTLNALGQNGDPKLKQHMSANLTSLAAEGVKGGRDAGEDLSALRSYRVVGIAQWGGGYKTANFSIALTKEPAAPLVWFLNGAEELKDSTQALSKLKFRISFPDDGPTRVVQRGMLSCSEASKHCTLVLFPVMQFRANPVNNLTPTGFNTQSY